jgi:hypothetical protein
VRRMEVAEPRFGTRGAAECRDSRREPPSPELVPRLLALPDVDYSESLVRRAGDAQNQSCRGWLDERRDDLPVVLPACCDVLDQGVCHLQHLRFPLPFAGRLG